MFLFVILVGILSLVGLQRQEKARNWLDRDTTAAVNGVFVLLIFLSHSTQYLDLSHGLLNKLYLLFQSAHKQLVVTTFLAFSGYGIMEQIQKRRENYLKTFPKDRILKTIIHFDIAILLYLIVNWLFIGKTYPLQQIVLALIGWEAVGNSNWYIFSILMMYLFTWISWKQCSDFNGIPKRVALLSLGYIIVMWLFKRPTRFTSTILCYSFGMYMSLYKEDMRAIVDKHKYVPVLISALVLIATLIVRKNPVFMNIHSIAFITIVVWCLKYIRIRNPILLWLDNLSFSIYILQRLPMNVFNKYQLEWYIFVPLCLAITIIIATIFEKLLTRVDKVFFPKTI